jgi:hypothetical protein
MPFQLGLTNGMEIIEINGATLTGQFLDVTGKVHDEFQCQRRR